MLKVSLPYVLQLCAMSFAFAAESNDPRVAETDHKHRLWGINVIRTALTEDISYIVQFHRDIPDDQNVTTKGTQAPCIGLILDSETIATSQACKAATSDAKSNSSHEIAETIQSPSGTPLAIKTLKLNPPMTLGPNFVPPTLIDTKERYEEIKTEDRFGILIAVKAPKIFLVRWYDQMTSEIEGENSPCEIHYSTLQQKNPGWPDSLPEGIFCIRGGRQNEGNYTMVVEGENVTIGSGLPCHDTVGSPIIIQNEGVLGVVTAAYCESDPQVTYAQSLAFINTTRDDQRNQTTEEPEQNKTTLVWNVGQPVAFYPMPSQYLASPFIKVIEPTPSSANHISEAKMTWSTVLAYFGLQLQWGVMVY